MKRIEIRTTVVAIAALLASLTGCEPRTMEPSNDHAQFVMAFAAISMTPGLQSDGEELAWPCPAGGRFVVQGVTTRENEADVSIVRWDTSTRYEACTMVRSGVTASADGQMRSVGEARFGAPVGQHAPLTFQQSSQTGTMTTVVDGTSRTCSYDLSFEFEAAANSYRVTGTACDRRLDMSVPARP